MPRTARVLLASCSTLGLIAALTPSVAGAEPSKTAPSLKAVRLAVAPAIGSSSYGTRRLDRGVRKRLSKAIEGLMGARELKRAQKKLRLRGRAARSPKNLARAARRAGADWVLRIAISRKGWLFTARALLIRADNAEVQMDFRSQYYKPKTEAEDRGGRIAERTLLKLVELIESGAAPDTVAARLAPPKSLPSDPSLEPAPDARPAEKTEPAASRQAPDLKDPRAKEEQRPSLTPESSTDPASLGSQANKAAPASPPEPPSAQVKAKRSREPRSAPGTPLLRASLTAGAGVLRTYDLSAPGLERSALSYRLDPVALFDLRADLQLPKTPLSVDTRVAFRPVAYEVFLTSDGEPAEPSGFFLDLRSTVGIVIPLSERSPFQLVPRLGAQLTVVSVGEHPGPVILNTTSLQIVAAIAARLPVNDVLTLTLALDGGPIVLYDESPSETGDSGIGYAFGGDLGARIWLTDVFAIAIETRFSYQAVGFSGAPTRQVPVTEQANLREANLGIRDLRSSIGVAVRL